MTLKNYTGPDVRSQREKLGLSQHDFWAHFGTTQSAGSRYESGREIPEPVQILLRIALGSEAKSALIVETLRQLAKPPKQARPPKGE